MINYCKTRLLFITVASIYNLTIGKCNKAIHDRINNQAMNIWNGFHKRIPTIITESTLNQEDANALRIMSLFTEHHFWAPH